VFFDDIMTEAGSLIDAQDASYPANNAADSAADNGADGPCGALTFAGATFHACRHSLRRCGEWNDCRCSKKSRSDKLTDHLGLLFEFQQPYKPRR
jgi:hypothetical protein